MFVRATYHDSTDAIPRAIESIRCYFDEIQVLCWDRARRGLGRYETSDGYVIYRFQQTAPPRSMRIMLVTLYYQWWVLKHILRERPAVIHALDLDSIIPSCFAARLIGSKVVYDMRDPFALSYSKSPLVQKILYAVDWVFMACCNSFVIPAPERREYLGRWARVKKTCIVLNTCPDTFSAVRKRKAVVDVRNGKVKLAFVGYLAASRGAEFLLQMMKTHSDRVELYVAGNCRYTKIQQLMESIPAVHYMGYLLREDTLRLMYDADAVLLQYDPDIPVNRIAAPNKFYESLSMGTPVIVSRGMVLAEAVMTNKLGYVVNYNDPRDFGRLIETLHGEVQRETIREHCRKYFLENCGIDKELEKYRKFYRELVKEWGLV